MSDYHLDLGAGIDAEHWQARAPVSGVRLIAMDPLITTGMVEAGRLARMRPDILRVGAEVRPARSVEQGKQQAFLPFRSGSIAHVHCGFMLHLYLETLEVLVAEVWRVLRTDGTLEVLLPHFGDLDSERTLQRTQDELERWFGGVTVGRCDGPFTTFWADLYQDRTYRLTCRKPAPNGPDAIVR
jgi:ubiquinone/menaquinone biosynthesis C-methylase UbiE